MKNYKFLLAAMLLTAFSVRVSIAQSTTGFVKKTGKAVTTTQVDTFKVLGNCGMCQKTIEKAAIGAGASAASWNKDSKIISVTFDPAKTSVDAIEKAIAGAGYDNAGYLAEKKTYKKLSDCCQYDRTGTAGGTKVCKEEQ